MRIGFITGIDLETKLCRKVFRKQSANPALIACAAGTVLGAQRAASSLIEQGADHLISFGVCGGLSTDVKSGDLILPQSVMMDGEILTLESSWHDRLTHQIPEARTEPLISVSTAITTPEDKQALYETSRAIAVDVESFAVMKIAKAHNVKGAIIRAVLDPASQSLPATALKGVDAEGKTRIMPIITGLLSRPQDLPELIRLGGQNKLACAALENALKSLIKATENSSLKANSA